MIATFFLFFKYFVAWFMWSYIYPVLIFLVFTFYTKNILWKNEEQPKIGDFRKMKEEMYNYRIEDDSPEKVEQVYAEIHKKIAIRIAVKSIVVGIICTAFVVGVLAILKAFFIWLYNINPFFNNSSFIATIVNLIENPMKVRPWFAFIMTCITLYFKSEPNEFKRFINYMIGKTNN